MKSHIRYEEYASYIKKDRPATTSKLSDKSNNTKQMNSHKLNDKYMEQFDKGFDELQQKTYFNNTIRNYTDKTHRTSQIDVKPVLAQLSNPVSNLSSSSSNATLFLSNGWIHGPKNSEGILLDASTQPLTCLSIYKGELVVGSCDHALYTSYIDNPSKIQRTLYNKKYGHSEWVTCVCHIHNSGKIVSGGMDSKLCLWDRKGTSCVDLRGHYGSISNIKPLDSQQEMVISSSYDKSLRLWDIKKRESCMEYTGHKAPVLAFINEGTFLSSGDRDGTAIIWDIEYGRALCKLQNIHQGHITCVEKFSEFDMKDVFFTGGNDGAIIVWDGRQKSKRIARLELHASQKGTGAIAGIKYASQANTIVTGGADKRLCLIDWRNSFKTLHVFEDHKDFIYSMHIFQGRLCMSGSGNGMLLIHDILDTKLLYGLGANEAAVRAVDTTPDKLITAGDNGKVLIYDMS